LKAKERPKRSVSVFRVSKHLIKPSCFGVCKIWSVLVDSDILSQTVFSE